MKEKHNYTTIVAAEGTKAKVNVFLDTDQNESAVYQFFRIEALNVRHLRYFTDDKFLGYHILQDNLKDYYIGDGVNILFDRKEFYRNVVTVFYKKLKENFIIPEQYKNIEFELEAPIPTTFGCVNCVYWREKNRVCTYYKKMGMDIKQNCVDFRQKEKKLAKRKKPAVPISQDQVDRSTQIKLDKIAESLGMTITELVEKEGNDLNNIIERYDRGELRVITE